MAASSTETDAEKVLDVVADVVLALDAALEAFRRYSRRAVRLRVAVTLDGAKVVDFPDDRAVDAVLTFSDRFGDVAAEPAPVTWGVTDPSLASVTPDPADDKKATVAALAGAGTFKVTASSGSLSGESEDLVITPGTATTATIAVVLDPTA